MVAFQIWVMLAAKSNSIVQPLRAEAPVSAIVTAPVKPLPQSLVTWYCAVAASVPEEDAGGPVAAVPLRM